MTSSAIFRSIMLPLALLSICACEKKVGGEEPAPSAATVKIENLEVTENSATFKVTAENAVKCSWSCIAASEPAPDPEKLLADGTAIDVSSGTAEFTAEGLEDGTEYKAYVAAKGEDGNAVLESADFSTNAAQVSYDYDFVFTGCADKQKLSYPGEGWHILTFNDKDWALETSIHIYTGSDTTIPAALYKGGTEKAHPALYIPDSSIDIYTGGVGNQKLSAGDLLVEKTDKGLSMTLTVTLANGETLRGVFEGTPSITEL